MASEYAKTLRQVINETLKFCGDYVLDGADGKEYTYEEAKTKINDLLIDLVKSTGILRKTSMIYLQEDVNVYNLPLDCLLPLRVNINGINGTIVFPRSLAEMDMIGNTIATKGDPYYFLRDYLPLGQIAFFPTPSRDGSSMTRDDEYGLLRRIVDEDGNNLTYDANYALRRIGGVPFTVSGDGRVVREVVPSIGNIQISYIRVPDRWVKPDGYMDPDIPDWIYKDIKYGAAWMLLQNNRTRLGIIKKQRAFSKWNASILGIRQMIEDTGPMTIYEPA